jgi:hypothetical protein
MVTHRIADRTILEVIGEWLKAGAMVDGAFSKEDPKFNCGEARSSPKVLVVRE